MFQDEAKARRKQILSSIGEDLLLAANDQPFRWGVFAIQLVISKHAACSFLLQPPANNLSGGRVNQPCVPCKD
jgi:hypothetical protein